MKRASDIAFACSCGAVSGRLLAASPRAGTHLACHCKDCRAAEIYAGQSDPSPDPVEIFQTTADRIKIDKGAENLAVFSFGEKNLLRWQASCCGAPLCNTLRNPRFSFVGVNTKRLENTEALGRIAAESFMPQSGGGTKHRNMGRFVYGMLSRTAAAALSGRWKDTPFFDPATRAPVATPRIVPLAERKALL
ncbi:hypothetical protein C1J03_16255 [Sulfitobacter sp. SK012]|uniref:DUF6151 family protein n=1 Tax=Sulfitobacter sp. SK012 TaxID=1389005 RepID=UPI000E0BFDA6|nr:DUF6151 family protein [Sulfitobacter sp. SK012]AXI47425.1 hypothetical protein C1J03_16255 [Sulfitobacter sp. SK012]